MELLKIKSIYYYLSLQTLFYFLKKSLIIINIKLKKCSIFSKNLSLKHIVFIHGEEELRTLDSAESEYGLGKKRYSLALFCLKNSLKVGSGAIFQSLGH